MIEALMKQWIEAKQSEKAATGKRREIEQQLESVLVSLPDEGTETVKTKNLKLTVKQNINRKIDERKARQVCNELPDGLCPINWVEIPKLDITGLRWLKTNEPGLYKIFSDCLTEKKAKLNFNVEVI
jgi:hypothetical protein